MWYTLYFPERGSLAVSHSGELCIELFLHATTILTTSISWPNKWRDENSEATATKEKKLPQNNVIFCQIFLPLVATFTFVARQKCQKFCLLEGSCCFFNSIPLLKFQTIMLYFIYPCMMHHPSIHFCID